MYGPADYYVTTSEYPVSYTTGSAFKVPLKAGPWAVEWHDLSVVPTKNDGSAIDGVNGRSWNQIIASVCTVNSPSTAYVVAMDDWDHPPGYAVYTGASADRACMCCLARPGQRADEGHLRICHRSYLLRIYALHDPHGSIVIDTNGNPCHWFLVGQSWMMPGGMMCSYGMNSAAPRLINDSDRILLAENYGVVIHAVPAGQR